MRCNDLRLERLLSAPDEEGAEFGEAALHLESCPRCRERLADLSGVDAVLAEACETLRERGETSLEPGDSSRSIVVAVERMLGGANEIDCETVTLDFLEAPSHPELLGRIGRYDVERLIGAGGMGVVLKGYDTELHRVVAIKVLLPHLATSSAARRRFAREAQAAAAVVHEHVIPIYDVESDGTVPYLVMQFVSGRSLQARVDEQGPLAIRDVLQIARQAASGLAAAHTQGLVHRDVKPANILLEESVDRVLLSDFGLARTVDDATLTRTGVLAGTPHYMSPEQAEGQGLDPRSDLFSLGSVIYFMCTGHPPFRADSPIAVLHRICREPHRPVDEINARVGTELADLVDELLAKDPGQRPASAAQVEARCASLLVALQQGRRLSRRRFSRIARRSAPRLRRTAIAVAAALGCMLAGAWLMQYFAAAPSGGPGVLRNTTVAAPQLLPAVPPAASLPRVPDDTFAQDLIELQGRLDQLETQTPAADPPPSEFTQSRFESDLAELQSLLSQREAAERPRQTQPDSPQTPPNSPTEPLVPSTERD